MLTPRSMAGVAVLPDGHVLIAGGYPTGVDAATSSAELFDPDSLTFSPTGPLTQTILVPIVGDLVHEPTETFRVLLSNATDATLVDPLGIVTVLDNDRPLPWRNPVNPFDVNDNGHVTGVDALVIINKLNTTGPQLLPDPPPGPHPFYDVSGDNRVTAIDALMIINELNRAAAARNSESTNGGADTTAPPAATNQAIAASNDVPLVEAAVEGEGPVPCDPARLLAEAPESIRQAAVATDPTLIAAGDTSAYGGRRGQGIADSGAAWQLFWAEYEAQQAASDTWHSLRRKR
jgi:hypothetical protein